MVDTWLGIEVVLVVIFVVGGVVLEWVAIVGVGEEYETGSWRGLDAGPGTRHVGQGQTCCAWPSV